MANNKAAENIVRSYLSSLPLDRVTEIVNSAIVDKNVSFTLKVPKRWYGDVRVVNLPNIDAASEFDELMESFTSIHSLTQITEQDEDYNS